MFDIEAIANFKFKEFKDFIAGKNLEEMHELIGALRAYAVKRHDKFISGGFKAAEDDARRANRYIIVAIKVYNRLSIETVKKIKA